jgi:uncharacterized protein
MAVRICFVELPTDGTAPARRFYAAAFGLEMTDFGPSHACTTSGDVDLGLQADRAEAAHAPLPVIQVESLAAAAPAGASCGRSSRSPAAAVATLRIPRGTSSPRCRAPSAPAPAARATRSPAHDP